MTDGNVNVRPTTLAAAAVVLLAAGAVAMYLAVGVRDAAHEPARSGPAPQTGTVSENMAPSGGPAAVTLDPEAVARAGIRVAEFGAGDFSDRVRLPGVVEPNGYRKVDVTPLVGGRITRVLVQLGDSVRRGQPMAEVFSPELAEAHTRYTAARADLEAHDRELQRTRKLVEIGAASRQELERVHAEHEARTADVRSARSRLELLGVAETTLDSAHGGEFGATAVVPAPIAGIVTERNANIGLNVEAATSLFTVVDLSTVWVVANLYERDFSRVRVGSGATIVTAAYPGKVLDGRVTYIDPEVSRDTRTARVRIEVSNPGRVLRLGMYADVQIEAAGAASQPAVPRAAVQNVGERQVVYVSDPSVAGRFVEREVQLGGAAGDRVEVVGGLQPGDRVVVDGSFFVRAEIERLGLRPTARATGSSGAESSVSGGTASRPGVQVASIVVNEKGFEPARVPLRAGMPARLTFLRTADNTCGTEVVFPSLDIRRPLPLNQPVTIEFTPSGGEIAFTCGMHMLHGSIVVQ